MVRMNDCMTQEDAMNMNNEQAVSILIPLRDMMRDQHGCPISDAYFALDRAIESLKQLTQPNTPNTLNVNALDTIYRQDAVDAMCKLMDSWFGGDPKDEREEIAWIINHLPSAQPDVPDTNVGDMISRQSAIQAINEYLDEYSGLDEEGYHGEKWCAMAEAKMVIENLPSTQPEQTKMIKEIREWINSGNRGSADYFIVDKIEEIINKYE